MAFPDIFRRLGSKVHGVIIQSKVGIQLQVLGFPEDSNLCLDGTGAFSSKTAGGGGITQLTGDVTAGPGTGSQVATLANTGVTPGTYGDATHVFQGTIDSKGRVTAAANVSISAITGAGRLLNIQYLTGSGTYTATAGTSFVIIRLGGPGGGGAGVLSAAAAQVNIGEGGGGGAFLQKLLTANFDGGTYVVGTGGAGGAAGNNNGTAGSAATSFTTTTAVVYSAGPGGGGLFVGTNPPPLIAGAAGGTGGAPSGNGDINIYGNSAFPGLAPNVFIGYSGGGGMGPIFGNFTVGGGLTGTGTSAAGPAANSPCSGGSGAISSNAGGSKAGGAGSNGALEIWEFS